MSLTAGLAVRIQHSHGHNLTSVSDWELKPCFKGPLEIKRKVISYNEIQGNEIWGEIEQNSLSK